MNICFCKFLIKLWCVSKCQKIWHASPVSLSFCCSLAYSMLPATMKTHFVLPSCPTPLTEVQKNKLWYTAKASEWIVWVPGQQSRLQVSFQFKVSFFICFLLRDGLENLKQREQTEDGGKQPRSWSQFDNRQKARVAEQSLVYDSTPAHSCSYLFRKEEILKKSPSPLPCPWPLSIPLQADRAGMWETMKDSPHHFISALKNIFTWQDRWLKNLYFVSLQFAPISCFPVTVPRKMPSLIWRTIPLCFFSGRLKPLRWSQQHQSLTAFWSDKKTDLNKDILASVF